MSKCTVAFICYCYIQCVWVQYISYHICQIILEYENLDAISNTRRRHYECKQNKLVNVSEYVKLIERCFLFCDGTDCLVDCVQHITCS